MSNLQANVPLVNVPFVDKNGNVTEAWFIFLIQLWRRTGGSSTPSGPSITLADVFSIEETFAQPVIAPDALQDETTLSVPGPKDSLADMIFAPIAASGGAGSIADQTFSSGTNFTPGTTTTLTLGNSFANASQIWVFFDAAFQGDDQYSLSGTTLTFTSAIPVGTNKVYVKGLR